MNMPLAESEKKVILAALGYVSVETPNIRPYVKALLTRAAGIVRRSASRQRRERPTAAQLCFELTFRKLPPGVKRKGRVRWARYPYAMVEEARRLRQVKKWTYRDISEFLNQKHGTKVAWISVRDWCSAYYRVTG